MDDFEAMNVDALKAYLKERGVTYSKAKKRELVDLCKLAFENKIEVDPDCFNDSIDDEMKKKLTYCGQVIPDPKLLNGTSDLSGIPSLNNFDIYDYLKQSDVYPSSQLRDFKNLVGYKLFESGYVESIDVCYNVAGNGVHLVRFSVKPTQRKEDPINHTPFYKGWIVLVPEPPHIYSAFCACKGGSDGVCRHTVATLLELADFVEKYTNNSVTSTACRWKKKERQSCDNPVEVSKLSTRVKQSSARSEAPCSDFYDPCPDVPLPSVDDFYNGLRLLRPNANILYNRFPFKQIVETSVSSVPSFFEQISAFMMLNPSSDFDEVIKSISFSPSERDSIEKFTRGQVDNPKWFSFRKGMLTASKFYEATHMLPSTNPDRFVRSLASSDNKFGEKVPVPLRYGLYNESNAKKLFMQKHKKLHKNVTVEDQGLYITDQYSFIGASPDGLVSCSQCGKFLLEIKCLYAKRIFLPKLAARDHCFTDDNMVLHLDPKSRWYSQIQGQMAICKFELCKLVMYTNKGIQVVDVPFDLSFWKEMEANLVKFYLLKVGPTLLTLLDNE